MSKRGNYHGLYTIDNNNKLDKFAFVWVDRQRMTFVSNTSSLYLGEDFDRTRFWQVNKTPDADPEHVNVKVQQPAAAELY